MTSKKTPSPFGRRSWGGERLYFNGDGYFKDVLGAIQRSKRQVDFEVYIFEKGVLGDRVVRALIRAANRGVQVRLSVDGIGSPDFSRDYGRKLEKGGVQSRVYRHPSTFFGLFPRSIRALFAGKTAYRLRRYWFRMNRRNHRKLIIVDRDKIWLGGFNVSDEYLGSLVGKKAWRDTGLSLRDVRDPVFGWMFDSTWQDNVHRRFWSRYRDKLARWLSRGASSSSIQMNGTRWLRRRHHRELLGRLGSVRRRIWITTPYFIPTLSMLRTLFHAARRGCDVRLLLPGESDIPFVRWASMAFYPPLLRAGCRIFEYRRSVLHAKTLLADDWALVGSSNFNHRSFLFDLEVDVVTQKPSSLRALERQYERDFKQCREVVASDLGKRPFWVRILMAVFYPLRSWF